MSDLTKEIDGYVRFFAEIIKDRYRTDAKGNRIVTWADDGQDQPSQWQPPAAAIQAELESPHAGAMKKVKEHAPTVVPVIEAWVKGRGINDLWWQGQGGSAAFFEARMEDHPSLQSGVRIGPRAIIRKAHEDDSMIFDVAKSWHRSWCPLVLQPYAHTTLACRDRNSYDNPRLQLEHLPLVVILRDREPRNFNWFLNDHVLARTPYEIDEHKDLGIMSNGTPVYVDPGSLNFKTGELVRKHAKDQLNPAWQQQIMRTIHDNCEKIGLKEPLSWVWSFGQGESFVTTQSILYPNPRPDHPDRKPLVRVKGKSLEAA